MLSVFFEGGQGFLTFFFYAFVLISCLTNVWRVPIFPFEVVDASGHFAFAVVV